MKFNKFAKFFVHANSPIAMVSGPQGGGANFNYQGGKAPGGPMQQSVGNQDTPVPPAPGSNVNGVNNPPANTQGSSPLDAFATLFDNPVVNKDDKSAQPKPTIFDARPEDIQQLASKIDVSSVLTPEMLKGLNPTNNPETQKALQDAFNAVGKSIFQQAITASLGIGKQGMQLGADQASSSALQRVNQDSARSMLTKDMPILSNPAYAPLVNNVMEQLMKHHKGADANLLYTKAKEYFANLNVQGADTTNKKSGEDGGIGDFFNFGS